MGLFGFNKNKKVSYPGKFTIYIAEDNAIYLKQLEFYLTKTFGDSVRVQSFPVSEVIEVKLEHGHIPDVIIMDYNLSRKYNDAASGLDAIKDIHKNYPKIPLILHSAKEEVKTDIDYSNNDYVFIPKGEQGLLDIGRWIEQKLAQH